MTSSSSSSSSSCCDLRLRLVVMGGSYVGKSSIIKRFLFNTFSDKYTPTVEDLFSRDYETNDGGTALKVDILDTAGDAQFPAMRRLSIAQGHAFLLVFSYTDLSSFDVVKQRLEEIREQRKDFQEIPIVIAANKVDLVRECDPDEVHDWVQSNMPRKRTEILDCSASQNSNVNEIFKAFLQLSKINFAPKCGFKDDSGLGLRRNLSAYGRLKSPVMGPKVRSPKLLAAESASGSAEEGVSGGDADANSVFPFPPSPNPSPLSAVLHKKESFESDVRSPPSTPRSKFLGISLSPFGSPTSVGNVSGDVDLKGGGGGGGSSRPSPPHIKGKSSKRSRSLIRRSSRKVKQQVNNVPNHEDCAVS